MLMADVHIILCSRCPVGWTSGKGAVECDSQGNSRLKVRRRHYDLAI